MPNNKETPAPLESKDIQPNKVKQPLREIQPKPEKLLNEPFTGAQALMLLGIRPPENGKPVPKLKETPIIEFANTGIPSEHKEKIRKASFNERDEYWAKQKDVSPAERMSVWRKKMNDFLEPIKKEPARRTELAFLKKLLKEEIQKNLNEVEVTPDTIYGTFMQGKGKGDVEFFARRIADNKNITIKEIEQNKDLIRELGEIYGGNSAKIAELLTHGIANVKQNPDTFIKSAQENLDNKKYGEMDIICPTLEKNNKAWETKTKGKGQVVFTNTQKPSPDQKPKEKDADQVKAEEVKKEIFGLAENKDKSHAVELLKKVQEILKNEKEEGKGKLKATIQETAKERNEYIREGQVVFIPEGKGELVVVTDLHGDLKTLKQVLEKNKFIENMESDTPSMQFVQMGDLVDRGPKQVEVMQLVLELKRKYPKNVTIFRADHEVYEGVSPHEFNDDVKKFYGLTTLDEKTELQDPLFGGFFKVFEELPRMAVASNGAVMVHGGPAVKPRTLSELGNLQPYEVKRVFDDEITWGDPVTKSASKNLEEDKAELVQYMQDLLNKAKGLPDEKFIEFTKRRGEKVVLHELPLTMKLEYIRKKELSKLESLPDYLFQKHGKDSKQEVIRSTKEFLEQHKNEKDEKEVEFPYIEFPVMEKQKVGNLKKAFDVLKSTPGFYPNGERAGSDLKACLAGNFEYSEEGLSRFLGAIGGRFMLRGHQEPQSVSGSDPNMFDGLLWTIHTTGEGSDESYYGGDSKYAVFPLNKQQDKIKEENIVSVWK